MFGSCGFKYFLNKYNKNDIVNVCLFLYIKLY